MSRELLIFSLSLVHQRHKLEEDRLRTMNEVLNDLDCKSV